MTGKHPADVCANKGTFNCHNCASSINPAGTGGCSGSVDADLVAEITRKVMESLK